jgi:hypothetical protein
VPLKFVNGDLRKSVLESSSVDHKYGAFTQYDANYSEADLTLGLGGVVSFLPIGPISHQVFDALPQEYDQAEIFDISLLPCSTEKVG